MKDKPHDTAVEIDGFDELKLLIKGLQDKTVLSIDLEGVVLDNGQKTE